MRSDSYHEIFVQKTPNFYDTAILSIAVCGAQEILSRRSLLLCIIDQFLLWRTRDGIFRKIPIFYDTAVVG